MEKLKKSIVICVIVIIILLISIIILFNFSKDDGNIGVENNSSIEQGVGNTEIIEDDEISIEIKNDNTLQYVKNREKYFNIKKIYNKYLTQIADNNGDILLKMFSEDYLKVHNLNSDNIVESTGIKIISDPRKLGAYTPMISDMLMAETSNNIEIYFVYGKYLLKSTGEINNLNLMVILDNSNMLYDIYPYSYMIEKQYNTLSINDKIEIENYVIIDRGSNKVASESTSDTDMANYLFEDWVDRYLYDTESAYAQLNTKYSSKRFKNYSDFQTYLNNLGYIPQINEYRTYSTTDYTDYICTDQYNNYYIFRQQGGIMRYTLFLDSYTVELDTFKQNYDNGEDRTKIAIQIGKFKQMLNSKDYNAIYNKLNNTFKQNNYSTVTKLENYLSKNIYDINTITIEDYSQNEDYYVCECLLQNQKNTNEQKNMTIVIKLIDSNNFEMSFSIN